MDFKDKADGAEKVTTGTLDNSGSGTQQLDFKQLFGNRGFLLFLLVLGLSLWLYWDGLAEAVLRWELQEEYSHGYLIPLVSLFILWEKRFQIAASYQGYSWWGLPIIVLALIILLVGEVSALYMLIHYSFILLLFGLSLAFLGSATRYTWVAIALLGFAVPLPYFIEVILTSKLQLISSQLGVEIIRLCRIPVFLSGNIIDLGNYQLQVVEACSGLRYLFPLMSLGFIGAYLYQASVWKRAVLFLSTVPITIFMNSLRIAITGILVDNWGTEMAEGFLHDFEGWLIFMACGGLLLLEVFLMELFTTRLSVRQAFAVPVSVSAEQFSSQNINPLQLSKPIAVSIPLLLLALAGVGSLDNREEDATFKKTELISFPLKFDDWFGREDRIEADVAEKLGFTEYVMINYQNLQHRPVNFYVAYYASQRKGVSPHSPKVCIPGGGWEIAKFSRTTVDEMPVNRVLIRKGTQDQIVYYWFEERGTPIANEYLKKWLLFKDALFLNRTDGSLVRVTTPVMSDETLEDADLRAQEFIRISRNKLTQLLPARNLPTKSQPVKSQPASLPVESLEGIQ
ncbi:MAG: VPLPA-CTERM-specific exosortase XrtD [Porticoccaceae bacterium]|nr:VPLPA-CTERM-specific exosortase XrtD [Porticoccaceae bacterium]